MSEDMLPLIICARILFFAYLLYKTLRLNKPYAVRHASEYPDPKIFWNFLDPGEQADLVYPGPKITGKFWGLGCAL